MHKINLPVVSNTAMSFYNIVQYQADASHHVTCMPTPHTHMHPPCPCAQVNIDDPSVLLPKLPKPKDLQPFPVSEAIVSDTYVK